MKEEIIQKIFDLIKENKKFPNYHAERRIDIFINYFLERILSVYLKTPTEFICPEFPIKKENNNQSTKLDYLCKSGEEIIFVELKTDEGSFSESQAEIYLNCDWSTCLINLDKIIKAVKKKAHKEKYGVLEVAIAKIKSNSPREIRVVYICPLIDTSGFKNTKVQNTKPISELDMSISEDEKVMWDFIKNLNLFIFEIVRI